MNFQNPTIHSLERLPEQSSGFSDTLLIFDQLLSGRFPLFCNWTKNFKYQYPVQAGEALKSVENFASHLSGIQRLASQIRGPIKILGIGGGSVTDFSGFVASVFQRGVELRFMPSTWLAAIDSAHGGKTGLNVNGIKNQIGTFHFPSQIYLVKELLEGQDKQLQRQAQGELIKIGIIDGGPWTSNLRQPIDFFSVLDDAIKSKLKIVGQDPFEKLKIRQRLNLGHTLGHAIELHSGLSHGEAVAQGIIFAFRWSQHRGLVVGDDSRLQELLALLDVLETAPGPLSSCSDEELRSSLMSDKKRAVPGDFLNEALKIDFVFIRALGEVFTQAVTVDELITETKRQALAR